MGWRKARQRENMRVGEAEMAQSNYKMAAWTKEVEGGLGEKGA